MSARGTVLCLVGVASLCAGCGGSSSDPGLEAWMRIRGAQYVPGALDEEPRAEAPVVSELSPLFDVKRGAPGISLGGTLGADASSALVGMSGDQGHWVLRASGADLIAGFPSTFSGVASFSPSTPLGMQSLLARAVAADGTIGPVAKAALTISDPPAPVGGLVIALEWDTEADLDLRVVAPDTRGTAVEVWTKRRLSTAKVSPTDTKPDAAEIATAGELDFDSNQQCVIDGRRRENVVWKQTAPPGSYTIRVDAFSLCGEATAHWRLHVFLDGEQIHALEGQMSDGDTRGEHGPGAGLTVLAFAL